MSILTPADMGDDNEVQCSECDAVFTVIFRRSVTEDWVKFCPFCGDEIEPTEAEDGDE